MLQLAMREAARHRDPKDSIVDALRVADQLQVEVDLAFSYAWGGMKLLVKPGQDLAELLELFDADVARLRGYYMRGSMSHVVPLRPSATAAVLREKLGLPDGG
jgi:hypothetical protein